MKKTGFSVLIAIVLILGMVGGNAFAALPGSGWVTNIQVQNVGTDQAAVVVTSYAGGTSYASAQKTAPIGGSATFLNTELGLPTGGFTGAGVVSSDQPIFGILFATNFQNGTANTASAIVQAVGSEKTAAQISFPLAKKNWGGGQKTTTFYIQNAGTANTNVTVTMSPLSGTCGVGQPNPRTWTGVLPSEQINFTPVDLGCAGPMYGAALVVSSGQPLAGIVLEADDSASAPAGGSRVVQGTTGFAVTGAAPDYDDVLIAPVIKKGWGANNNVTGLQVQNVGAAEIPIGGLQVVYTVAGVKAGNPLAVGDTVTENNTVAIPVGAAFNSLHPSLPNGTLASAVVTVTGGQVVGIVNENRPSGTTVFRNTTYSMLPQHAAATRVSLPLVKEFFGAAGGRCTGVQVVPVGGNAQLRLTYTSGANQYVVTTDTAVAAKSFLWMSSGFTTGVSVTGGTLADMRGKNFGVTAESLTAGVPLVAIANESFCQGTARDEDDANYEAFALP